MPTFYVDEIDIEPYEYVESCSKSERVELVEELIECGTLPEHIRSLVSKTDKKSQPSLADTFYSEAIDKLSKNRLRLTSEEEELIFKIANRL